SLRDWSSDVCSSDLVCATRGNPLAVGCPGHDGPLHALAWTADGKRIASGGADRIIRLWDAQTGRCLRTLTGHSGGVFDVAFSPEIGRASCRERGLIA